MLIRNKEKLIKLIRWPEDKVKNTVPWFVILRRLPALILIFPLLYICWFIIALGWGLESARDFKDTNGF